MCYSEELPSQLYHERLHRFDGSPRIVQDREEAVRFMASMMYVF
jgi:hypothetical protein